MVIKGSFYFYFITLCLYFLDLFLSLWRRNVWTFDFDYLRPHFFYFLQALYVFWTDLIGSHSARFLLIKVTINIGVDSNRFDFAVFWFILLKIEKGVSRCECQAAADKEASGSDWLMHFEGLDYSYAVVWIELVKWLFELGPLGFTDADFFLIVLIKRERILH